MSEIKRTSPVMAGIFAALMLALSALCVYLGTWQVHRLAEKVALIAAVDARLHAPAIPAPGKTEWAKLDTNALNFQPVTATGVLHTEQTIRIFTSLVDGRGPASGPGYWIVAPLTLADGGSIFVNRGFVPEAQSREYASRAPETVTVSGLLRPAEAAGMFTPAASAADRIDWVRDPARLAAMVTPELGPFAPFYIDQAAGPTGTLPQGGETVIEFPNNHLGYAITWYGFAVVAVIMLGFWLWRQRRRG
ncbi:SURF1 family protein [Devosia sp.]|uniref:SURF1 family protein n=1 Tax=Devosia sp. TaxID=1871048 RepID=UPI003265792C